MHGLERIGLVGGVARHGRDLGRHVRTLGERQHVLERGEVGRLGDVPAALQAEVVEHQVKGGIAFRHLVGEVHVFVVDQHHRRNAEHLHLAPDPCEPAVEQWLAQHGVWKVKRMPSMPGCFFQSLIVSRAPGASGSKRPIVANRSGWLLAASLARSLRSPSQDGGTRITRSTSGLVHLGQQFLLAERLTVRFSARGPRPFGCVGAPDMDLCVASHHGRRSLQGRACSSWAASA